MKQSRGAAGPQSFTIDELEPRRLMATVPVAVNFNDEALYDANFATSAAQAKALGVQAVRMWLPIDNYNSRPNAWDPVAPYGAAAAGELPANDPTLDQAPRVMARAFQLQRMGFSVMLVVQADFAATPSSTAQVKSYVRHLMDSPETPGGATRLKNVVDYWEIGNEPDSGSYWAPSASNKATGLKSYVNSFLIPAAQELNSAGDNEDVVSAGVSFSPNDLNTIIYELKAANALGNIDYLGFHPYGTASATGGEIATNTATAKRYADAVGKPLMATEWNIRGYGNYGANDATWARTLDSVYRNTILPNYAIGYYFTLINNWAGRGGTISARPGGLLKHTSSAGVTPTSPALTLRSYYNTPVVPAEPFYSTFKAWQYGTITGTVTSTTAYPAGTSAASTRVYVDANANGVFDATEPSAVPTSGGAYTLTYSVRDVPTGTYALRLVTPASLKQTLGVQYASLTNLQTTTGKNFTVAASGTPTPTPPPTGTGGTIAGTVWNDANANAVIDAGEAGLAGWMVFLDSDGDGTFDAGEATAQTVAGGYYTIAYPATAVATRGTAVRAVLQSGYATTSAALVTPTSGGRWTNVNLGVRGTGNVPSGVGAISGALFGLGSTADKAAVLALTWKAFIDADNDGVLDANERSVAVAKDGTFVLSGLAAGTYKVALTKNAGWAVKTPAGGTYTVTVGAGQTKGANNFVIGRV